MVERKKRKPNQRNNNDDKRSQKRRISNNNNDEKISKDELVIYRILCPNGVVGGVIGKSGKVINEIRHTTKAKIKVFDQLPGCSERVITIYCSVTEKNLDITKSETETETEPLCVAQDALLRVHDAIVSCVDSSVEKNTKIGRDDKKECRLLVPSSQSSSVIGKAGSNIKKIRSSTRASVKVVSRDVSDPSHACAMEFDNILLISGEAESVKKALFAVSAIMYKTNPREQIPLESTVQEVPASVVMPLDLSNSVYPQAGLYTSYDPNLLHHGAGVFASALPVSRGFGGSSRSEELVLKVLCPLSNIGRVIGRDGATVKKMREASGSRIDVNRAKRGDDECVIIVTATESPDDMKSMAVEAVLLLQEKINDEDEENVKMQLLVPSKALGCVIGKNGSVITEIRKRTNANIRITKGSKDDLVEVSGEVSSVRDALIQIVLRLREDVLGDRGSAVAARNPPARSDDNSFFSGSSNPGFTHPSFISSAPEFPRVSFDQRRETEGNSLGMVSSGRFYGYGSFPGEDNGFGSVGSYSFERLHPSSALEILVPEDAVSKVMGKGGGNLENIRRISGALVEFSDSKTSNGDRIALISGTREQMRSAEDLFQAFIMST
ncbi:unnamed protein product [Thlaspi arvense]|uniref:K Homology domain-containing protein n=1 Tax=Thlaspi arvense TaxID=13288 RepID=A0AAU9T9E5_THLAR|nr:unnamed protein product [Thlaspi arvense]